MGGNALDLVIRQCTAKGGTLLNRTETTATIVEPKQFDALGCLLLGFLPYVLWYGLVQRDKTWYVEAMADGTVLWNGRTAADIKRQRLVRNVVYGVLCYMAFTLCCWALYAAGS